MPKKQDNTSTVNEANDQEKIVTKPDINSLDWNEYVLGLLSEDEKISGNPTTDGLRRVFEIAMECRIISSTSQVVQSPDPNNEKRATVCHSLTFRLNPGVSDPEGLNTITVDGSADVYWGNCDKIYRNHPVAVAETRAEGRALRRALRLRKVVAAEELSNNIEDDPDGTTVSKITNNQINFIDVLAKRLDINVHSLLKYKNISEDIYNMSHDDAVVLIRDLSKLQQNMSDIDEDVKGYDSTWKTR